MNQMPLSKFMIANQGPPAPLARCIVATVAGAARSAAQQTSRYLVERRRGSLGSFSSTSQRETPGVPTLPRSRLS